jgi:hypothetical protein
MARFNVFHVLFLIFISVLLLASCGKPPLGYGVLLWSPDEETLPTGTIMSLLGQSRLKNLYTSAPEGTKDYRQIDTWRIRQFETLKEAREYLEEYNQYRESYAQVQPWGGNNLPLALRSGDTTSFPIVYRLGNGQILKIIERVRPDSIAGYDNYWYKVLTNDGTTGYSFGLRLKLFEYGDEAALAKEENPLLTQFFNTVYRPSYYLSMLNTGNIELTRFRTEYGLFPDRETNTILMVLEDKTINFSFSEIRELTNKRFRFVGANLEVAFIGSNTLNVTYLDDTQQRLIKFELIETPIEEIISQEQDRRVSLYSSITDRGTILESANYGQIALLENQAITWEGYELLVPNTIPQGSGNSGQILFDLFLPQSLAANYDGAFTLSLGNSKIPFLFRFMEESVSGIQIIPLDDFLIDESVIQGLPINPFIIFFEFVGSL